MSWQLARQGPGSKNPGPLAKTAFPAHTSAYPNEQILTIPVLTMLKETGYEIRGTNTPAEGGPCLTSCKGAKQVGFTVVEGLSADNKDRSFRSCHSVQSASGSAPFRDQPVTSCATAGIDL